MQKESTSTTVKTATKKLLFFFSFLNRTNKWLTFPPCWDTGASVSQGRPCQDRPANHLKHLGLCHHAPVQTLTKDFYNCDLSNYFSSVSLEHSWLKTNKKHLMWNKNQRTNLRITGKESAVYMIKLFWSWVEWQRPRAKSCECLQ